MRVLCAAGFLLIALVAVAAAAPEKEPDLEADEQGRKGGGYHYGPKYKKSYKLKCVKVCRNIMSHKRVYYNEAAQVMEDALNKDEEVASQGGGYADEEEDDLAEEEEVNQDDDEASEQELAPTYKGQQRRRYRYRWRSRRVCARICRWVAIKVKPKPYYEQTE